MSKLYEPLTINTMTLKNRTFMAPMSLGYESQDGCINEAMSDYWLRRAQGNVGCIILDALSVDPAVPYLGNTLCFRSEESISKFKEFTDKVHAFGCKVIPQITHPGPESISSFFGVTPVASSSYINSMGQKTRALTLDEIPAIIEKYAKASYQAKLAGFDGIELHCAHAYMLLGSFLSPMRNKRCDQYGGSLDNRARLLLEVIDAIKDTCGKDFPIILRISGSERDEQGNSVEDIKYLVPLLEAHGIDAFEISGGTQYERCNKIIPCHGERMALNLEEAKAIREVANVPVILVGKILDAKLAEAITEKDVDGVVFGRALLSDPDFVKKAQEGKYDEIAPCAACGIGCIGEQTKRKKATCVINPAAGREKELELKEAVNKKTIVVVGGGIGGMAAARCAAICGHKVTLLEQSNQLGGQLNMACVPPHKQEVSKWIIYLKNELERLQVPVVYNCKATKEIIDSYEPDSLVIATGAKAFLPAIEGIQLETAITSTQLLKNETAILGGNVLVVGGGIVGIECCEYLMHHKRGPMKITMIEMSDAIGKDLVVNNFVPTMKRLEQLNITLLTNCKLCKVNENSAEVELHGQKQTLDHLTHIVYACGSKSENSLYEQLKDSYDSICCIGDAVQARNALEAVRDAYEFIVSLA